MQQNSFPSKYPNLPKSLIAAAGNDLQVPKISFKFIRNY